jgi:hypothetical protein
LHEDPKKSHRKREGGIALLGIKVKFHNIE